MTFLLCIAIATGVGIPSIMESLHSLGQYAQNKGAT